MTDSVFVGKQLLVVDDEPANRRLLNAILAPEGVTIVQAANARRRSSGSRGATSISCCSM